MKSERKCHIAWMLLLAGLAVASAYAAQDVVTALEGTVKKVDAGAKTIVVKTADGTEHVVHLTERTVVCGAKGTARGAEASGKAVAEGSEVVVHVTKKGGEESAEEIDHVGKDGMKVTEGTVSHIDRGAKTLSIKTADGAKETFHLTDHAVVDAGKGSAEAAKKTGKVTVYYTEEAGRKTAHFFKRVF